MHPFIQHIADKENPSLDERAILGAARLGKFDLVLMWLRQLNPHHLRGVALDRWARDIAYGRQTD